MFYQAMFRALLLVFVLLLSSCTIYRLDVHQGNILKQEDMAKLRVGMNQREVRDVIGSPTVRDVLAEEQWVYPYFFKPGYGEGERRTVILVFDKEGKLKEVRGDVVGEKSEK